MKKISFIFTAMTLLIIAISSCRPEAVVCIRASGPQTTENRTVQNFSEIELQTGATVYVAEDTAYSCLIEGPENLVQNLVLTTRGGRLIVKDRRCVRGKSSLVITIHAPSIHYLSLAGSSTVSFYKSNTAKASHAKFRVTGSGSLLVLGSVYAGQVDVNITGSGDVEVPIVSDAVSVTVTGSGNALITGVSTSADVGITGSGDVDLYGLVCRDAYASISGSGNTRIFASDNLDVNISGSGTVYYKGWPRLTSKITGSGRIVHEQ